MKVLQVITGISMKSGGPTRSVKGLCRALDRAGVEVTLLVLGGTDEFEHPGGVKVIYGLRTEPAFIKEFQVVHLHGLWSPKLHKVAVACRRAGVPYVVSPRGMLDPWALSVKKWKKLIARWLYQDRDLRGAAAFHATAELEAENIRKQGFRQPIIVAPNGVELGARGQVLGASKDRVAVFMGRLHPGKGLVTLAEAWGKLGVKSEGVGSEGVKGWKMVVVGPDSYGHKKDIVAKLEELGIKDEWDFVGMVGDEEKWKYYHQASLLIHPSVSENFGITIAEGLAAGLPVICTKGTPWHDIADHKCGWWIDIGVEPLTDALTEAMALSPDELQAMGARGRKLVEEKYTWEAVVKKMIEGYREVLNGRT